MTRHSLCPNRLLKVDGHLASVGEGVIFLREIPVMVQTERR